ncbi:uncharacterized protein FOMMEDRAFT_26082 [Fomitiporia mediterranea MF3/22]|uniref:uncharacterized protein n=1 Tax=Fomitiporia mediterranea (strain MF3/22) TaxID=694068 RepID=UPI0004408628|nr:uncharacterized protein FOMMEDRAFT_26082 [Fomitiporia mediterranea MF3/22]EJD06931.1 hypothetical protein FOMMEDRAFT_26082 [Fomitiporia mediterranea MF3/22]
MTTQLTVIVRPHLWLSPLRTKYEQEWDQKNNNQASYKDIIRMMLSWLSKLMVYARLQHNASQKYHASSEFEVSTAASICEIPEPEEFAPSEDDPIHIPAPRQDYHLKPQEEDRFSHIVHTSDINSDTFRGFIRIFVADRPFYDPSGPPEWSAEYKALYQICGRSYAQSLTEDGYSVLHPVKALDVNEVAELVRINSKGVIGNRTVYHIINVKIFEEASPYSETEFSALPPSRPICKRPTKVGHSPGCRCSKMW